MRRLLLGIAIPLVLLLSAWDEPPLPPYFTVADTMRALEGRSALVRCIVRAETGGTYNPYSIGDNNTSFGVAQLHYDPVHGGLLPYYFSWGASRYGVVKWQDPYTSVDFLEWAIAHGMVSHWHTSHGCGA